ncbi:MAG TPA: hypothetical protein VMI73_24025 [Trebonia sp.]|nr:hypothetical protein [Trebonia sp.]
MEHASSGTRATDPELDEALARAIRQLIAEAVEAGEAGEADPEGSAQAAA